MEQFHELHLYDNNIDNITTVTEDFESLLSSNNSMIMDISQRTGANNNSRLLSILNNDNAYNNNNEDSMSNNEELFFPSSPSLILPNNNGSPFSYSNNNTLHPRPLRNFPTDSNNHSSSTLVSPKRLLSAVSPTIRKLYSPPLVKKEYISSMTTNSPKVENKLINRVPTLFTTSPTKTVVPITSSSPKSNNRKAQRVLTSYGQKVLAERSADNNTAFSVSNEGSIILPESIIYDTNKTSTLPSSSAEINHSDENNNRKSKGK